MNHLTLRQFSSSRIFHDRSITRCRRVQLAAFTLIELLVVIAIIAVLAVIALGVYQKTTKKAQQASSVGRLRSLGMAGLLWSNDNDGWSPPAAWYAGPRPAGMGKSILSRYGTVDKMVEPTGYEEFWCPAMDPRIVVRGEYINYGINALLATPCDEMGNAQYGAGGVYFWDRGVTKLFTVSKPTTTVFFMATGQPVEYDDPAVPPPRGSWVPQLAHYHTNAGSNTTRRFGGKASIFWLDGHSSLEPDDWMKTVRGTTGTYESPQTPGKYFIP